MPSSFEELLKAKTLLGLSDRNTLFEIKHHYKELMKKWHPDANPDNLEEAKEMSVLINSAYEKIMLFCKEYYYDLSESSIKSQAQTPSQWWEERFSPK